MARHLRGLFLRVADGARQAISVKPRFCHAPALGFQLRGVEVGRDAVVIGVGADYKLGENTNMFLDYNVSATESQINQGINLGVRFAW